MTITKPKNVITLKEGMKHAEQNKYALGAFSARYTDVITPILKAGQEIASPLIVQVSQKEFNRYETTPEEFAKEFYRVIKEEKITVPVVLHLDHTKDFEVIKRAIDAGFTSVMIDASESPFEENIKISKEVSEYAHAKGVSVEAELGLIGTTDFIETDSDEELYTDPNEAKEFVERTEVDALAVSVGTAHGVYKVREPKVDIERLTQIRENTDVHLVLHGGSGVPASMIHEAIEISGGGISKVNIATDIELSFLKGLNREESMLNEECLELDDEQKVVALAEVQKTVIDKMRNFVLSENKINQ